MQHIKCGAITHSIKETRKQKRYWEVGVEGEKKGGI